MTFPKPLFMSTLLILTYLCIDRFNDSLNSELGNHYYVLKEIVDNKSSSFHSVVFLLNHVKTDDLELTTLKEDLIQIKLYLKNPLLLKSKPAQNILNKYDLHDVYPENEGSLSYINLYHIYDKLVKAINPYLAGNPEIYVQLDSESRKLFTRDHGTTYKPNKVYKLNFEPNNITQLDKHKKYNIIYTNKKETVNKFPHLIEGIPEELIIEFDITDDRSYKVHAFSDTFDLQLLRP